MLKYEILRKRFCVRTAAPFKVALRCAGAHQQVHKAGERHLCYRVRVSFHGTLFLPNGSTLVVDGIDKVTFDGNGNFTQVDAVAMNGHLDAPGWRPGTGTYSVNPDCTGTQTIVVPGLPDLHLQFIVAQSGNTIHQIVIDPGFATTAEGERVHAPKFSD